MKVTLRVTAKHIEDGVKASCQDCPVALAVIDIVRPEFYSHVSARRIRLESIDGRILWSAISPQPVQRFIRRFDDTEELTHEPFECDLDIPKELLR